MAEPRRTSLQDLRDMAKAATDGVTGLGDQSRGPLVQGPVFGTGHLQGMVRLGMAELRQAASFGPGSVEQPTPPGIYGSPTQGEIASARGGPGAGPEQEGKMSLDDLRGYAKDRAKEAEQKMDRGQDRGMEM